MEQELERLEGTVEDIIYLNEDNGYTVFEVSGGGVVTVVCGVVGELHAGESVVWPGQVREPRHLWPTVPRTGVRDGYAQRPRGRLRLPRQPVAALHRRTDGGIRSLTNSARRRWK